MRRPAMLALMKHMTQPEIHARIDALVMTVFFSGHIVLKLPIIMPSELGLAKPQTANVAMAELRNEISLSFFISPSR